MRRPLIAATDHIHPEAVAEIQRSADFQLVTVGPATSADLMNRVDVLIVRNPLPADCLAAAPNMKAVIRHGAGLDMIPVSAASEAGILVANVPALNALAVAEQVVGQIISLSRHLYQIEFALRTQDWETARALAAGSTELRGKTVSIIGVGAVGRAVASICAKGFRMRVLGVHPSRQTDPDGEVTYVPLRRALEEADFLVLACPLTPETEKMIAARELGWMKPTAALVNVARGRVVDSDALADALEQGVVTGAALDVFDPQPVRAGSRWHGLMQARLTPHTAGITQESMRAVSMKVADQVRAILAGSFPEHWVNTSARDRIQARWTLLDHT
ncbi:MAG TPA: NAD(P)-dependent oxidoreductase [Burkholderiaceae bacterium]|nr:NAD(P)-dependent oxidoreductase [Burkholderiaceae bacterium]